MNSLTRTNVPERIHDRAPAGSRTTAILRLLFVASMLAGTCFTFVPAKAQGRDHLTDAESELVRDNQELDKRMEVFIKAMDRRFAIITGAAQPAPKKKEKGKDQEDWGELPTGTHAQLLEDIAGILDEAITNIDDVSRRDEKNPLIARSTRALTAASNRYLAQLAALKNQTKDPDELAAIDHIVANANEIIEVGTKVPAPAPESEKKKKKP